MDWGCDIIFLFTYPVEAPNFVFKQTVAEIQFEHTFMLLSLMSLLVKLNNKYFKNLLPKIRGPGVPLPWMHGCTVFFCYL